MRQRSHERSPLREVLIEVLPKKLDHPYCSALRALAALEPGMAGRTTIRTLPGGSTGLRTSVWPIPPTDPDVRGALRAPQRLGVHQPWVSRTRCTWGGAPMWDMPPADEPVRVQP